MKTSLITLLLLLVAPSLLAMNPSDHRLGVTVEPPFNHPAVDKNIGLTITPFKVSGLDEESLLLFKQAISATHGFFLFHAERLFREVILRNPRHPMPYAFAAYSQLIFGSGNVDRGDRYNAKAMEALEEFTDPLTQRERDWIDAIASLYQNARGSLSDRQNDHIEMLRDLVENNPNDFEAKAFLALALWNWKMEGSEAAWLKNREAYINGTTANLTEDEEKIKARNAPLIEEANQLIEDVIKEFPNHPVHHYKIHLWNTPGNDHLAIDSAKASGNANSAVAHLWHMPAHIFNSINEPVNAAWQLEASQRVDNKYLTTARILPEQIHNHAHNFDWLMIGSITTGGLKNLNPLVKSALSSPRLSEDSFYATAAASHFVAATEHYELWQNFIDLYDQGYLKGLAIAPYSDADVTILARIQRALILSLYNVGSTERAEALFADWKRGEFIPSKDLDESSKAKALKELSLYFDDLNIRRKIIFTLNDRAHSPDVDESLLKKLTTLRTPASVAAWIALEVGLKKTALELATEAQKAGPYGFHYPGSAAYTNWTLAHMMFLHGKVDEAEDLIAKTCKRVDHRLMVTDLPMLKRMAWARDQILACAPQQGHLEHMLNTNIEDLGPIELKWPKFSALPEVGWTLPEKGKAELIVFSLGKNCPACNRQFKGLSSIAPDLEEQGISLRVISADGSTAVFNGSEFEHTKSDDQNKKWFDAFGVRDEFTGKPLHAIYLLDENGNVRFYHRSVHAILETNFLLNEFTRLLRLPMQ